VSIDRRFATAYNAALLAANMAVASAGYRVTAKMGHHRVAFTSAALALGPSAANFVDYFETCRRKRNMIDYTRAEVATETEAREILQKAAAFHALVEAWIEANFPALTR
jgi:hypothetical protein